MHWQHVTVFACQDNNAYFELEIIDDEDQMFTLSPTNGTKSVAVALVVNEPRLLDYEQTFQVVFRVSVSCQ